MNATPPGATPFARRARARAGAGLAVLSLLLGLAAGPTAQAVVPTSRAQEEHAAALRAERTAALFAAWEPAGEEARAAARAVLADAGDPDRPLGARPDLATLARALRHLRGEDADDPLVAFADSLDLQVRPGAFAADAGPAGDAGRLGAPLTVRVYRSWEDPPAPDAELELEWIAPDGTRTRARREPFGAQAYRARGFDMYVRAPLAPPGIWQLRPVVHAGGRAAAGHAVPVESVPRLAERVDALRERLARAAPGAGEEALVDLLERGTRRAELAGADELLRALEPEEAGIWLSLGSEVPDANAPRSARLVGGLAGDGEAPRGALVLLWTGGEREDVPLRGPVGAGWRRTAREHGLELYVLELDAGDVEELRAVLAEVARRSGGDPILVARGVSVTAASLLLVLNAGRPLALDGLVLAAPSAALPRVLPPVPVLAVLPERGSAAAPERVTIEVGDPLPFLGEPDLPAAVGRWLSARR